MILYVATGDSFARLTSDFDSRPDAAAPAQSTLWAVHTALSGSGVTCLAVDPRDARVVYCGSRGEGIWKTSDGGGRWENVTPDMGEAGIFSLAVSPADGALYAGCEPSMLWVSHDGGHNWDELENLRSIPSQLTWSFPPRPYTSHVRWIAPNPHHADWLLVGIEAGGVMFSSDGGWSWDDHRPGAHRDTHALAWHPTEAGRAYQAAGGGCALSADGGWSWQSADEGLDWNYCWGLALDPDDASQWFCSAAASPREAHSAQSTLRRAAIYRRREAENADTTAGANESASKGASWHKLGSSHGLPDPLPAMPYALATHRALLCAGLGNGDIWISTDRGEQWKPLTIGGAGIDGVRALAIAETGR